MLEAAIEATKIHVLIVDDSKLARVKLKKMLEAEPLQVHIDMAETAESALDYLKLQQPDVIFLDHNMPGMSGLAALKIIKANPATATIPIMMYTSQSDDLYIGKARALGAFDVLVKENMQATSLSKRLRELKLRPKPVRAKRAFDVKVYDGSTSINRVPPGHTSVRQPQVQHQRQQRQEHLRVIRRTTAANSETLQQHKTTPSGEPGDSGFHRPVDFQPGNLKTTDYETNSRWLPLVVICSAAILAVGLVKFFTITPSGLVSDADQMTVSKQTKNSAIVRNVSDRTATPAVVPPVVKPDTESNQSDAFDLNPLFDALAWAMGRRMVYAYDEQPLAGNRLDQLRLMLDYLGNAGFTGEVNLVVYQGDYCLNQVNDGRQTLPETDSLLGDCSVIVARPGDLLVSDLQSVEFARFLSTSSLANGERGIVVNISSADNEQQLYPYPAAVEGLTAAEWNASADQNNTIEVVINRL